MSNTLLVVLNVLLFGLSSAMVSRRDDQNKIVTNRELGFGNWGSWKYCNPGEYMEAINVWNEPNQGAGDDSGANMIDMRCSGSNELLRSESTPWAPSAAYATCPKGNVIKGFVTKVESYQGSSADDTGLTNVKIFCTNGFDYTPAAPAQFGIWGNDGSANHCEDGSAFCGFRVRIEAPQGSAEDTSINAVQYACCGGYSWHKFSAIKGRWDVLCTGCNQQSVTITQGTSSTVTKSASAEYYKELSASITAGYEAPVGASVSATVSGTYSARTAQFMSTSMTTTRSRTFTTVCDKAYYYQWKMSGQETIAGNTGTFTLESEKFLCTDNPSPKCVPGNCNLNGTPITSRRLLNFV